MDVRTISSWHIHWAIRPRGTISLKGSTMAFISHHERAAVLRRLEALKQKLYTLGDRHRSEERRSVELRVVVKEIRDLNRVLRRAPNTTLSRATPVQRPVVADLQSMATF